MIIAREDFVSNQMIHRGMMVDHKGSRYLSCLGDCRHPGGQARGCHVGCIEQLGHWPLQEAIQKLAYQYEPTSLEVDERINRLHDSSFLFLLQALPQLPSEIISDITMMCLRTFAVDYAKAIRPLRSGKTIISVSSEVWAHGIMFEGRQYLTSLSNKADGCHNLRLFVPNPASTVTAINLREDYLGVREIVFRHDCSENSDLGRQDIWWRVLNLNTSTVVVEHDVGRISVIQSRLRSSRLGPQVAF